MKRLNWFVATLCATVALLAGLLAGTALADGPTAVDAEASGLRIEAEKMAEIANIAKRSEAYLVKHADGTITLNVNDATALGVSDKFLSDYKAGLEAINAEIRSGRLQPQADGTLKVAGASEAVPTAGAGAAVSLPKGAQLVENPTAEQLAAARPALERNGVGSPSVDWSVSNSYNSFYVTWTTSDAYWYRYYPYYQTWPAAMAAYVGYPYISVRLVYLFSYNYNHTYFNSCTYPFGSYWYIPWNYLCQYCTVGYYPVYFYTRYVYIYYGYYYYTYAWRPYTMYY